MLAAADLLEEGASVVIAGAPGDPATQELLTVARAAPDPAVSVLRADAAASLPPSHPAHGKLEPRQDQGRSGQHPGPVAYFCRAGVCSLPISDPAELARRLRDRHTAVA